jgi:hypothetical protein
MQVTVRTSTARPRLLVQIGLAVVVACVLATPGFASITPCTAPASNTPFTTYQPASSSNGCTDGNLQFTNFTIGTGLFAGGYVVSSAQCGGTTCTIPAGTVAQADAASVFIGADTPYGPHWASTSVGGSTCKSSGVGNGSGFCASGASQVSVTQIGYLETALSGTINFIGLAATLVSHSSGMSGATAIVFEEFCPGATTFSQGCAGYGILSVGLVQGHFLTITASAGQGFGATTTVAVRDTVWLQTLGASGEWASMDGADAIAPEPATLGLVGLSLLGLGGLHFRHRKRS